MGMLPGPARGPSSVITDQRLACGTPGTKAASDVVGTMVAFPGGLGPSRHRSGGSSVSSQLSRGPLWRPTCCQSNQSPCPRQAFPDLPRTLLLGCHSARQGPAQAKTIRPRPPYTGSVLTSPSCQTSNASHQFTDHAERRGPPSHLVMCSRRIHQRTQPQLMEPGANHSASVSRVLATTEAAVIPQQALVLKSQVQGWGWGPPWTR